MVSERTRRFVLGVAAAAVLAVGAVGLVAPGFDVDSLQAAAFFSLLGIAALALGYRGSAGTSGSISLIPFLGAVAAAPSLPTVIAAASAVLASELLQRREQIKALFNVSQSVLSISLAVLVLQSLGGHLGPDWHWSSLGKFSAAYFAFTLTNTLSVSGAVSLERSSRFFDVWKRASRGAVIYDLVSIPTAYAFAYLYLSPRFGPQYALGWSVPLFVLRQLYKTNYQLDTINQELLQLMVAAIEARDPYTSGHSQRVADYSRIVSRAAGLGTRATERVYTAALLHDVGKIHEEFAPILRKPGRLTDEEYSVMKSHSEKGAFLVQKVTTFKDLVPAIRGHHEAWSGRGYPDGLSGDQIPLWARIIAFADTIDAMTTDRPYRAALSADAVREEVRVESGVQFDPRIASALLSDIRWREMATAIQVHGVTRKATPLSIDSVPRHSAPRRTIRA